MQKNVINKVNKLYILIMYIFLYMPIVVLVIFSFNSSKLNAVWTGFSIKWYQSLFQDFGVLEAMKNSLVIAFASTIASIIIGTLAAFGMYKYAFSGKNVLDGLLYIPIVIPEIVMGISLLAFFGQVNLPRGMLTLILAHITFSISYVVVVVRARLDGFDKSLEEAAADLGATGAQTFFKVTLPIIMPGIIAGGLLAFTLSLDDVIISFFTAGPQSTTFPLKVYSMVKFGVTPEINALSTIMMIITLTVVYAAERIRRNNFKKKRSVILVSVSTACVLLFTCGIFMGYKSAPQQINVFNWSEYLPQSVINEFEKKYNVKVNYSTFSSNEEMLAKITADSSQYDVVVASDYMVEIMKKQNLIKKINLNQIPNFKNISGEYKNLPFDPKNEYSIPYMGGDAAIAVDKSKVKDTITGYSDLWKPEFKNSLVVLDDQRAVIGMVLKKMGYSINETDPEILQKAKDELAKLQPNIKAYDSDSPKTLLINGEAKVGFVWGAEIALAKRENKDIEVVIPKEGLFLEQDNFVILHEVKHEKLAQLFINFILDPKVSVQISKAFPYPNPNKGARMLLDKATLNDKAVYPPNEALKSGEYLRDIGQTIKLYDKIWSQVKQ